MPRVIWKGAISFGLVHVPVALYRAAQESGIDFDWLDKRTMDPVGHQRINKRTGKPIESDHVVKGIKQADGDYVVLSDEQTKAAYPQTTQTIEIEAFVQASEIDFTLLEKPYFLEPVGKGEKVYALLREAMLAAGVMGSARVVMHTKEHLAALIPSGTALMLNTLRWATEIRAIDGLKLPAAGADAAGLKPAELKMAAQLIRDMTTTWKPQDHTDRFSLAIQSLVDKKLAAGDTETVTPVEQQSADAGNSNVLDLTALLAKSLARRAPDAPAKAAGAPNAATAAIAATARPRTSRKTTAKFPARKRA